ncbi:hypothetical protein Tco_0927784 [Tanacetum coccineum]
MGRVSPRLNAMKVFNLAKRILRQNAMKTKRNVYQNTGPKRSLQRQNAVPQNVVAQNAEPKRNGQNAEPKRNGQKAEPKCNGQNAVSFLQNAMPQNAMTQNATT